MWPIQSLTQYFIVLLLIHIVCGSNVYYITPSPITHCPTKESCFNLSMLTTDTSYYCNSNTTLIFLAGNHTLNSDLSVSNSEFLRLSTNDSDIATITCSGNAGLKFTNINHMQIIGLEFMRCSTRVECVDYFLLEDISFHNINDDSALMLTQTNTTILRSSFASNTVGTYIEDIRSFQFLEILQSHLSICPCYKTHTRVGGAVFVTRSDLIINGSHFDSNVAEIGGAIFSDLGSNITISNNTFINNSASCNGGALFIGSNCIVIALNNTFKNNTSGHSGGAIALFHGTYLGIQNVFSSNEAGSAGGAISMHNSSKIAVDGSAFNYNEARHCGGVMYSSNGRVTVDNSSFNNHVAGIDGGVMDSSNGNITLDNSSFNKNEAGRYGGVMHSSNGTITMENNLFNNSVAGSAGGVMYISRGSIALENSSFNNNKAVVSGGVVYGSNGSIVTDNSSFNNNRAYLTGGVMYSSSGSITIKNSSFNNNRAGWFGGVVRSASGSITMKKCSVNNNEAGRDGGVMYSSSTSGSIAVENSSFKNNKADLSGGVMHSSSSSITIDNSSFNNNEAGFDGGVMYASSPRSVTLENNCIFHNNTASIGGAVYLNDTSFTDQGSTYSNNTALKMGGGLHTPNSYIIIKGAVHFTNNEAINGGGISLERNAKLNGTLGEIINFASNRASQYGGALYVADETYPDICTAITTQNITSITECFIASVFINFSDNFAGVSGVNLFGGLLDRCITHVKPSQIAEMDELGVNGFQTLSNINESHLDTISSHPVRLCFCRYSQPDCNYQPEYIQVSRGNSFSIDLIAYNQVFNAVNATIHCSLNSSAGGLGEGQVIQHVNEACSTLQFDLFSSIGSKVLRLSMMGPCDVIGYTERSVRIEIICSCPIGFQVSSDDEITCDCVCHQVLQPYDKTECNYTTESITRKENFWITYDNLSGYIIYPHCPFDYCYPPENQVSINLNLPNGSNTQCASNRSGTLCGTCKSGLSISLGSSRCLPCPSHWLGLLVIVVTVFILSGIGLVTLLLVLNLTVAVGTLNAIIFYTNIMAANKSVLFSASEVSFASVFISWLNFDFGFDTCFYDGMDVYVKTWLQLAFPAYIILLVAVVIRLSHHFDVFGRLIGRKDPVATLATLVLLSYAKLLQTIITVFSSATLSYPDGTKKYLWLSDASVEYLSSKHTVLFITAILILLVGLVYTLLLFLWQWFLYCPRNRIKWICNQKLNSFLETYHVPYTPKHRYWTGLLLFVRVCIYLVSAFNQSNDPRITLLSTTFTLSCLFFYIAMFGVRIYKHWFINAMEMFTYFNIITLSIFTWHIIDTDEDQAAVTNTSVGTTFIQLLVVIFYHMYKYVNHKVFSRIQETVVCKRLNEKLKPRKLKRGHHQLLTDIDIHQFHELLDVMDHPVNINNYNIPQVHQKPAGPTSSVVDLPKCHLAPPAPPLEEIEEEPEPKSQQQFSAQDDITVAEENQSAVLSKQCLNNCSGIVITDIDDVTIGSGIKTEYSTTTFEAKSVPKFRDHSQTGVKIDNSNDVQHADSVREETPELSQSNITFSSHEDQLQSSGELDKSAPPPIHNGIIEVETHND